MATTGPYVPNSLEVSAIEQSASSTSLSENPTANKKEYFTAKNIAIAVFVLIVIVLLYMAWKRHNKNMAEGGDDAEGYVVKQERTDTLMDYNVHDAIRELENLQSGIVKKLSSRT